MDLSQRLEKFHDENRYFIPLVFVSIILMTIGLLHLGPIRLNHDVLVDRTLLFDGQVTIQAVTLRPGWTLGFNVIANKPVNLTITNLFGEVVAESFSSSITYEPEFFDTYFVKVSGSNYAILDFNYYRAGMAPYPNSYSFFASGLILLLGVIIYYLLEPWKVKLKRSLELIDAVFYPLFFLLVSIVFWVFRDSLLWSIPKSYSSIYVVLGINIVLLVLGVLTIKALARKGKVLLIKYQRDKDFFKSIFGYLIGYAAVFTALLLDYSISGYASILIRIGLLAFLGFLFFKYQHKTGLVYFALSWFNALILKVLVFTVGVPVFFDTFLASPSQAGTIPLFIALQLFALMGAYFLMKGFFAKTKARATSYGLYASVCVQSILQVFVSSSLL